MIFGSIEFSKERTLLQKVAKRAEIAYEARRRTFRKLRFTDHRSLLISFSMQEGYV